MEVTHHKNITNTIKLTTNFILISKVSISWNLEHIIINFQGYTAYIGPIVKSKCSDCILSMQFLVCFCFFYCKALNNSKTDKYMPLHSPKSSVRFFQCLSFLLAMYQKTLGKLFSISVFGTNNYEGRISSSAFIFVCFQ